MELSPATLVLATFPVFWVIVVLLIGQLSGWAALATIYGLKRPYRGPRWWFQSAMLRWGSRYRGCLILGGNEEGLYMAAMLPFRPGHAPFFVPWEDVTIGEKVRFGYYRYLEPPPAIRAAWD